MLVGNTTQRSESQSIPVGLCYRLQHNTLQTACYVGIIEYCDASALCPVPSLLSSVHGSICRQVRYQRSETESGRTSDAGAVVMSLMTGVSQKGMLLQPIRDLACD